MSTDPETPRGGRPTHKQPPKDETLERERFEFIPLSPEKEPKGPAHYRDPANPFNTWTGLGKRPIWLSEYIAAGRKLSEFEIKEI